MSVRNGFVLLLAISTLSLLVGCGGSSSPTPVAPPSGGYSPTNFSGTYVISIEGADANFNADTESFFAIVGTIAADGNGNITGGLVDINDPDLGAPGIFLGQTVSASTYTVGADGRGTGTLVTPIGTFAIDFVLTLNGHGLITRFDQNGSGSGTLDLQQSTSQSALTAVAFSLSGTDPTSEFLVDSVGAFTLNSSGIITGGNQDFNENGSSAGLADLNLGGSLVLTSGTAGTAVLSTSSAFGTLGFDVWVIDSTHMKLIETDSNAVMAGDAYTQPSTSIPSGVLAFTMSGGDSSGTVLAVGGLAQSAGGGTITSGIEDYNDGGVANTVPNFTGSCTTVSAVGRCQLALTGFSNGVAQAFTFAAYPSSGGIQLLEVDSLGILQGSAYVQSATSFAASEGYGLNLSGDNGAEVDDIAEFTADSATASPNMTGIMDENDLGTPNKPEVLSGVYTPDSAADGRGSISVPTLQYGIQMLNAEYDVIDGSTMLFIEVDGAQVAAGTFELQSASSSPGAAQPGISRVRPMLRSVVRGRRNLHRR